MIKLCIAGSKGKMGLNIIELAKEDGGFEITGQFDIGEDARVVVLSVTEGEDKPVDRCCRSLGGAHGSQSSPI